MAKPKFETRVITHEFRVSPEGETPSISGYAALFDSKSDDLGGWTEEIDAHAFDTVINQQPDVRALFNHDANCVLGRTTANTLHLSIDARGLAYVIDPPDTTLARDLIVSMRRKDVTQSSFGFICKRDQWTENSDGTVTRRILEFDELLDVSPVTYPAYSQTTSTTRSLPGTMPSELRSKITSRSAKEDSPGCQCDCVDCLAGNCDDCMNDECIDEQCSRSSHHSKHVSASEHRHLSMQLALLRVK